jgi:aryl-alcohol dehydrogenase-like predicted oxidoreductase
LYRPRSSQPPYNLINRSAEAQLFGFCAKAGIGQVVYSPLAQGVLSGKYKPNAPFPAESRAQDDRQNKFIKKLVENPALLEKVQKLHAIAQEHELSASQLAIAWILRRSEVTSCILGATRPQQLEENAKASGVKLGEAIIRRVDELFA